MCIMGAGLSEDFTQWLLHPLLYVLSLCLTLERVCSYILTRLPALFQFYLIFTNLVLGMGMMEFGIAISNRTATKNVFECGKRIQ